MPYKLLIKFHPTIKEHTYKYRILAEDKSVRYKIKYSRSEARYEIYEGGNMSYSPISVLQEVDDKDSKFRIYHQGKYRGLIKQPDSKYLNLDIYYFGDTNKQFINVVAGTSLFSFGIYDKQRSIQLGQIKCRWLRTPFVLIENRKDELMLLELLVAISSLREELAFGHGSGMAAVSGASCATAAGLGGAAAAC